MRFGKLLVVLCILVEYLSASATIIHIPADYPEIQQGINASSDGDTVLVQQGTYVENINFNGHNITLGSLFLPSNDTFFVSRTIIDGDSAGSVVTCDHGEGLNAILAGFTLRNGYAANGGGINCSSSDPTIKFNIITDNIADSSGGGIYCDDSDPLITNNIISGNLVYNGAGGGIYCGNNSDPDVFANIIGGNLATMGGGVYCLSSNPTINNNIIYENVASGTFMGDGGGICLSQAGPVFINNTLSLNLATNGGGMAILDASYPLVLNTVIWGNTATNYPQVIVDDISMTNVGFCDIQDSVWPGPGNISIDPLFKAPDNDDFHLMSINCGDTLDSPCIDAGMPDFADSSLSCLWGLGTLRSDMGGYGGGPDSVVSVIADDIPVAPAKFILMQNYPNPFNSGTTIRFSIVRSMEVRLAVYDLLGREVQTLIDEYKQAGIYTAIFDAADLSSGVYFCKMQVGEAVEIRPMVLLR
jgi:parallel beta-helix repeat protein